MKEHKKDCCVIQLPLAVGVCDTIGYDGGGEGYSGGGGWEVYPFNPR